MKKNIYIRPTAEVTIMESVSMIALSAVDQEGGDAIRTRDQRGTWGNLWDDPE